MANAVITKKQIHDELSEILQSARVIGAEGLVVDLQGIVDRIKKDI